MGFASLNEAFQSDIASDRVAPPFFQGANGKAWLGSMGQGLDMIRYRSAQAQLLHMPGFGDPSGLYYVGLDRLIPQGPNESNTSYATRLTQAFDSWRLAGTDYGVLRQILGYLAPFEPSALIVNNLSQWAYYGENSNPAVNPPLKFWYNEPALGISLQFNWNWDSQLFDAHPALQTAWWRCWLIINAGLTAAGGGVSTVLTGAPITIQTNTPHGLTTGNTVWIDNVHGTLGANGGPFTVTVINATQFRIPVASVSAYTGGGFVYKADANNWVGPSQVVGNFAVGSSYTVGLSVPAATIAGMVSILRNWKSANSWFRYIIVSFDSNLFNQDAPKAGGINPDGTFGPWAAPSVANVYLGTRFASARYADGVA